MDVGDWHLNLRRSRRDLDYGARHPPFCGASQVAGEDVARIGDHRAAHLGSAAGFEQGAAAGQENRLSEQPADRRQIQKQPQTSAAPGELVQYNALRYVPETGLISIETDSAPVEVFVSEFEVELED